MFWPNPVVSSATGKKTSVTGDTGVKMTGPYEYVAPAIGRPTRPTASPDANVAMREAAAALTASTPKPAWDRPFRRLRACARWCGKDHMWPIDDSWNYHAGGGEFKTIGVFTEALDNRYGKSDNVEDFATKSQMQTYEGERAMYRGVQPQQVRVHRRDSVDAQQRLAFHDLAPVRLLSASRRHRTSAPSKPASRCISSIPTTTIPSPWSIPSTRISLGFRLKAKSLQPRHEREVRASRSLRRRPPTAMRRIFTLPEIQGLSPVYFVTLRWPIPPAKW